MSQLFKIGDMLIHKEFGHDITIQIIHNYVHKYELAVYYNGEFKSNCYEMKKTVLDAFRPLTKLDKVLK